MVQTRGWGVQDGERLEHIVSWRFYGRFCSMCGR